MPVILVNNLAISYRLRRAPRAKRLQLVLREQYFEIVAPLRLSNQTILNFIWQKRRWMAKVTNQRTIASSVIPRHFYQPNQLWYRGQFWPLVIQHGTRLDLTLINNTIQVNSPFSDDVMLLSHVINWLKQETERVIQDTIQQICPILDRWPSKVSLKEQKTRWGSCGVNNAIHINWLLIFAPPGVLEYVIIHELCHLIHRNHGVRFWQKVAKCLPDHEKYQSWLQFYGHNLMSIQTNVDLSAKREFSLHS